jgi:hypothetical protein
MGEDRRLSAQPPVEGVDLAPGREGRLLRPQDLGRKLPLPTKAEQQLAKARAVVAGRILA